MSQVRIVTDSTADIPADLREKLGIAMVPLKVLFGQEVLRDAVDIGPEQFYGRLTESNDMPTTSQPSPVEFQQLYQKLAEESGGPIISIHLSSRMSGTYQSAVLAKSMVEGDADIEVVDSRSASYGIGMLVVAAAEAARQGKSKEEILELIAKMRQTQRLYFLVDTLEYLQRGGRIGKAAALFGSLLNIKPILSINAEGEVYSVDKIRGQKKAMNRIVELLQQDLGGQPIHLILAYTTGRDTAEELKSLIAQHFTIESVHYTHIGPVIGTHVGPGTVAAFALPV
ncbi:MULTISPECIES: DegV family protein [Paenibacillus]|uniref:Fatty acid-binding protein n=1 Tax=Paenibacillus naphthalenovorans TaxID=162209 RepID=A0A0U2MV98_9BACL|nr:MULTISPECIES: DegV family protein [Paenibacillus]ALS21567.1 fatty acid-binding protein [Paenibacillus naphthalenovorans]NTZ18274.1 DegV family protein [Paenibacillus sp. JMULE4]GCL71293.1 DegV family protein [Paenibacillus naphthalenovorans]SDI74516.1 EDD domain protein, DegV family [Paenibacillus naphthalenovorans]